MNPTYKSFLIAKEKINKIENTQSQNQKGSITNQFSLYHEWPKIKFKLGEYFQFEEFSITGLQNSNENERVSTLFKSLSRQLQLHQWSQLNKLSLKLWWQSDITDDNMKTIGQTLSKNFADLRQLYLSFIDSIKISDKGLVSLFYFIGRYLHNLKELRLILDGCFSVTDQSLKIFESETSKSFSNIEKLSLHLGSCGITNKGIQLLSKSFRRMENLKRLELNFKNINTINDIGIGEIMGNKMNRSFLNLTHLALNFSGCILTDEGINILANNIKKLTNLQRLLLLFVGCFRLTDKCLKVIEDEFRKELKHLEFFVIDLSWCYQLTTNGLNNMRQVFSCIPKFTLLYS